METLQFYSKPYFEFDTLVQDCDISSALKVEILQSCLKLVISFSSNKKKDLDPSLNSLKTHLGLIQELR